MPTDRPTRKFFLLKALTQVLGPDQHRRSLSVEELEALCHEHAITHVMLPSTDAPLACRGGIRRSR